MINLRGAKLIPFVLVLAALVSTLSACHHAMAPPKPYLALVADRGSNTVAVVNLGRFRLARVVSLGFSPERIVSQPGCASVFITSGSGSIARISFPALAVRNEIEPGRGPVSMALAPGCRTAYVLAGSRSILTVDPKSLRILGKFDSPVPLSSIDLDARRGLLVAEDTHDGALAFFKLQETHVADVEGVLKIGPNLGPMVIAPGAGKAFIAQPAAQEVTAVDLGTRQVLSHIEVGAPPTLLALKPDEGELFAISAADSTMTILNVSDDSVEESHPSGAEPVAAVFSPDSTWLYVANSGDGTVTRMNVKTRQQFVTHLGLKPDALALTPDQRFLAVADESAGRLTVIRAHTGEMVNSVPVGADPVSVVIPGWLGK